MGANSHIQWTDHTFNPWEGCTKVSPGCLHCYAEARNQRFSAGANWGKGAPRRRTSAANWRQPIQWNRDAGMLDYETALDGLKPRNQRVFCASLADWLDDEVPIEWLADLLELISKTPNLDWQLLTKRPENWKDRVAGALNCVMTHGAATDDRFIAAKWVENWLNGKPRENVWIGTTVEDQKRAEQRIPALLKIPAKIRFLSCEPLLEAVDLDFGHPRFRTAESYHAYIHWVICGGESGPGARPFLVDWADDLRRQCETSGVPFFMKQLGAYCGTTNANALDWPEETVFHEVPGTPQFAGARVALKNKKGGEIDEFPVELRVRNFPIP